MTTANRFFDGAIVRLHDLLHRYDAQVPLVLGALVGIGAGLGAVLFRIMITNFHILFFDHIGGLLSFMGDFNVLLIPVIGAVLFSPLIYFFAREAKGHGVPEVMLAVQREGGKIRPRVAVVKSLASSICIASGGSVGREGPIVQIGSALGSTIGQGLRLPPESVRLLVACGAAGGISATFNAPVAGVFFALEVILGRFNMKNFSVVVLSAVVAAAIGQALMTSDPAFIIPLYDVENVAVELPLYALLGVLAAPLAIVFMNVLYKAEDFFEKLPIFELIQPLIGALAVGAIGVWQSDVFGVGYEGISATLLEDKTLSAMAILVVVKIAATSLTLGSGGSGGVFAPSLFLGAMFGGVFGFIVHTLLPGSTATYGAYATVGMAAVFAGTARAPITAIIILFEMTRDYNIILPVMTAVVIAATTAQLIEKESIYTAKLKRRGIDLSHFEERPIMRNLTVAQAMTRDVITCTLGMPIAQLTQLLRSTGRNGLPVVSLENELVGIVTQADLERGADTDRTDLAVQDLYTAKAITAYPDDTLDEAIHRMSAQDLRQLPVVSRSDPKRVVGMVTRSDIITAYTRARANGSRPAQPATAQPLAMEGGPAGGA